VLTACGSGKSSSSSSSASASIPASVLGGCDTKAGSNNPTTITLAGPNQWSASGKTFGPAWEALVAAFEKCEPGIKLKTVVMPITTFYQTLSTQLSAGTAPELVFNQATYQPNMVYQLDGDLAKPNPYVADSPTWLSTFNPKYYGPTLAIDAGGRHSWVPLTLSATALLYNKDAFKKAGVTAPITTFADLITACGKLTGAGYAPLALDDSDPWVSWVSNVIFEMTLQPYFDKLNYYDATGKPGTNPQITSKDWAKAILSGELTTKVPEVAAALQLMKQVYNTCGTKNWSGITSTSGSMSNPQDFLGGKAAMSIGTSFAGGLFTDVKFQHGTMPFPTITTASTDLSTNYAARFGVSPYGSAFLIPSTTKGAKLAAALKFLQFATAPANDENLVNATTGVPSVTAAKIPEASQGFIAGDWGTPMKMSSPAPAAPAGVSLMALYDGYFLGSKSLNQEQSYLQGLWTQYYKDLVRSTPEWAAESWAK
jgi:multiple sugar transport system substrate-binding protein